MWETDQRGEGRGPCRARAGELCRAAFGSWTMMNKMPDFKIKTEPNMPSCTLLVAELSAGPRQEGKPRSAGARQA